MTAEMRAQACCIPSIADALRTQGERDMSVRATTLRRADRGGRNVVLAATRVGCPHGDANPGDPTASAQNPHATWISSDATRLSGDASGHLTEVTQHCVKTTQQGRNAPRLYTDAIQHGREVARLCTHATQHGREVARLCTDATQHGREVARLCTDATQHGREVARLASEATRHAQRATRLRAEPGPTAQPSIGPHPAVVMLCLKRGRCAARTAGSHSKIPPPGCRSSVFR
jgi:antitoxin (DNA-binding transcriptional repressor) of toxin-antitoxin stability system